jgi:hypothetical protein
MSPAASDVAATKLRARKPQLFRPVIRTLPLTQNRTAMRGVAVC